MDNTRHIRNLALIGFMGTGKSTVGRAIADALRFTFLDTDDVIAFTRRVVRASTVSNKAVPVELHVLPTVGHRIHDTAHEEAAAWILACMKNAGSGR